MQALILNSGKGTRMGDLTKSQPKCMTRLNGEETILSHQIKQLEQLDIDEIVITTGYLSDVLKAYVKTLRTTIPITFVHNPLFETTNYIYSMALAQEYITSDVIMMHGDLVFDQDVLQSVLNYNQSCGVISSTSLLPDDDFKANITHSGDITHISTKLKSHAYAFQPLYKLLKKDWDAWLKQIKTYELNNNLTIYAEDALNDILPEVSLMAVDVKSKLCSEIDTIDDLNTIKLHLRKG